MGERTTGVLKRRGLLAGVVAAGAGLLGRLANPQSAEAGHTGAADGVFHLEVTNNQGGAGEGSSGVVGTTRLVANGSTNYGPTIGHGGALRVVNLAGFGITVKTASGYRALIAETSGGTWAIEARNPDHSAIRASSTNGTGVVGIGGERGLQGSSSTGTGVYGQSGAGAGVYGLSTSSFGVFGGSSSSVGVFGNGVRNAGVFGTSPIYGVWGRTGTGFGVNGEATGRGIGVYGKAGAGGFAGYFDGPVFIAGHGVIGGGSAPQTASAQTVESFGEAQLVNGAARVTLDPVFAEAAKDDGYLVFLTEGDDLGGLYFTERDLGGFQVRARKAGAGGTFTYRVVAKGKRGPGQAAGQGAAPSLAMPKDVPVPTAPELPKVEEPRPGRGGGEDAR